MTQSQKINQKLSSIASEDSPLQQINDGQFLNLSGQLHGKFYQHLDARYLVTSLGGHCVPLAAVRDNGTLVNPRWLPNDMVFT